MGILGCLAAPVLAGKRVDRPISVKGLDQSEERVYLDGVADGLQVLIEG